MLNKSGQRYEHHNPLPQDHRILRQDKAIINLALHQRDETLQTLMNASRTEDNLMSASRTEDTTTKQIVSLQIHSSLLISIIGSISSHIHSTKAITIITHTMVDSLMHQLIHFGLEMAREHTTNTVDFIYRVCAIVIFPKQRSQKCLDFVCPSM